MPSCLYGLISLLPPLLHYIEGTMAQPRARSIPWVLDMDPSPGILMYPLYLQILYTKQIATRPIEQTPTDLKRAQNKSP